MRLGVRTGKPPDSGESDSLARRGRGSVAPHHKTAGYLLGERRSRALGWCPR
jgi:hypothetical protein